MMWFNVGHRKIVVSVCCGLIFIGNIKIVVSVCCGLILVI